MARTHTEIYRPLEGELKARPLRFWPLVAAGIRVAVKRKLPLLILYGPPAIATIVFSFIVYGKYAMKDLAQSMIGIEGVMAVFAERAVMNIEVKGQIVEFNIQMRIFALLVVAWFGSGLFADDRRLGAQQLYFARPISRMDYFLGKLLTVAFFGACAVLVPGLVICLVAAWNSPDWSFLREEGSVILETFLYAALWISVVSVIVLCVSSLFKRKTFALAGIFGFFMIDHAMAEILGRFDHDYRSLSLFYDMRRIGHWIFGTQDKWGDWLAYPIGYALGVVGGTALLALLVLAWRLRRLEVVA